MRALPSITRHRHRGRRRLAALPLLTAVLLSAVAGVDTQPRSTQALFSGQDTVTGNTFATATLQPPTSLVVSTGGSGLDLSWQSTPSTFADGYKVYRASAATGPWTEIATVVGRATTTYTDTTAPAGTSYYQVKAYRVNWLSGTTNTSEGSNVATPGAPTELAPTRAQHTSNPLYLQFRTPSDGGSPITSYRVMRNDGAEVTKNVSYSFPGYMTSVSVPVPDFGSTWTYKILAANANGDGPWSTTVSWVRPDPIPPSISSVNVSWEGYQRKVAVSLPYAALTDGDSAVTQYEARASDVAVSATSTSTPVLLTANEGPGGLVDGQTHTFEMRASNAVGTGPWSASTSWYLPVQWWPRATMPGAAHDHAMARDNNGYVYVLGGRRYVYLTSNTLLSAVYRYNPATNTWTSVASMPWARERHTATTGADGRIYVIGGLQSDKRAVVFNGSSWSTLTKQPVTGRVDAGAATDAQGRIYVVGGNTDGTSGTALATVERYDPANPTAGWQPVASMSTPRSDVAVVADSQGRIYAMGGLDRSGAALKSAERFDPATGVWSPIASPGTQARSSGGALDAQGRIYLVFPGVAYAMYDGVAVSRYDPATDTWERIAYHVTGNIGEAAVSDSSGRIYVSGGKENMLGTSYDSFQQYDPSRGPR